MQQVDLGIAMVIGVQVGTTTALSIILRGIISRLDKQNGNVEKLQEWQIRHLENEHTEKKK